MRLLARIYGTRGDSFHGDDGLRAGVDRRSCHGFVRRGVAGRDSRGVESGAHREARAVITDGTGQYRIVDLRPGVYTVTFSLSGFNGFKRDGIALEGASSQPSTPTSESVS